jgi:hypothetical protein
MPVKIGQSLSLDPFKAVVELHNEIYDPAAELILFFCSSHYDLHDLAKQINHLFSGITVIGCTSAGEIGPKGYVAKSITGISFSKENFKAVIAQFDLQAADVAETVNTSISELLDELNHRPNAFKSNTNRFALQLIDGLSRSEEVMTHAVHRGLGDIPMIGGSSGDDLRIQTSQIFFDGSFRTRTSVLTIIETDLPFKIFKTQHFIDGKEPMVVTEADVGSRIVYELNGMPAAEAYAKALGVEINQLNADLFANAPVVIHLNGNEYVRSIQKANSDGSLSFYCAIDRGLVLRIAHGIDLIKNLEAAFERIHYSIGQPQLVIGFDCVLRRLEMEKKKLLPMVATILTDNLTVGFNTYGEQFVGIHVNQTFTGIAIGKNQDV